MVMKAGDLVSLSFGQLLVSHGVPLCFFGEKKRTRTGSWPLLSYAPWVLQLLSEFAPAYRDTTYTPPQNIISIVLARTNGVVGGDISTQRLQQMLDAIKLPADGFSVLIDGQGNIIASKDQALVLQPISSLLGTIDLSRLNSDARQVTPDEIQHQGHAQLLWSRAIPHSDWLLLSVVDKTTLFAPLKQQLLHQALLSSAVLLGSLLLIGALIGTLVRPLRRVSSTLALISDGEGDLTQRMDAIAFSLREQSTTATEIAHQVVRQTLQIKPEMILPVVREAVASLNVLNGHPALFLHPDDARLVRQKIGEQLTHNNWRIIEDAGLTRGGCRVEMGASEVDATVETRWRRVIEAMGISTEWLAGQAEKP